MAATVESTELTIVKGENGAVTVNGANVTNADVLANNGVVHVIDKVLTLPSDDADDGESGAFTSTLAVSAMGILASLATVW